LRDVSPDDSKDWAEVAQLLRRLVGRVAYGGISLDGGTSVVTFVAEVTRLAGSPDGTELVVCLGPEANEPARHTNIHVRASDHRGMGMESERNVLLFQGRRDDPPQWRRPRLTMPRLRPAGRGWTSGRF
jgi:hypothetical protein